MFLKKYWSISCMFLVLFPYTCTCTRMLSYSTTESSDSSVVHISWQYLLVCFHVHLHYIGKYQCNLADYVCLNSSHLYPSNYHLQAYPSSAGKGLQWPSNLCYQEKLILVLPLSNGAKWLFSSLHAVCVCCIHPCIVAALLGLLSVVVVVVCIISRAYRGKYPV